MSNLMGRDSVTSTSSISTILGAGDIVTGIRGTTDENVVLTGAKATGNGTQSAPFLYQGPLTSAADGAAVSVLTPSLPGVTTAAFYGPNTHFVNPDSIPAGQVRAVGSYRSSASSPGVVNHGMIYLGPVSGPGGSWTSIDVPADGRDTVGGVRACSQPGHDCSVANTIAHSTMGNLVVGNYDLDPTRGLAPGWGLNPGEPGDKASFNAFIYNLTTRQWTLLQLGASLASKTTVYGIWQNGGPGSPHYTLAGGSSAPGNQQAFLMNYNEQTGAFGEPAFYSYGNAPARFTHFDGITAVPGGFHLVAISSDQASSLAFVPATGGDQPSFGPATWYPIDVAQSPLCSGGCGKVTGNTVYEDKVMGLYLQDGPHTYLATVSTV